MSDDLVYDSDDDHFYDSVDDAIGAWWEGLPLYTPETVIDVPVLMETEPRRQPTPDFKDVRCKFLHREKLKLYNVDTLAWALAEALNEAWSSVDDDGTYHVPSSSIILIASSTGEAVAEMDDEGDIEAVLDGLREALVERAPVLWWPTDRRIDVDEDIVALLADVEADEFGEFLAANLSEAMVKLANQATDRRLVAKAIDLIGEVEPRLRATLLEVHRARLKTELLHLVALESMAAETQRSVDIREAVLKAFPEEAAP